MALKVLPPEELADPERKRRFTQEAKAASALNHPHIITIHDISSDGGVDFIAMEYVPGKTLDQLIPRNGMRLDEALKIAVQVADALAAAHAIGIVHRDVKPSNVMVSDQGRVKVLDFGMVKLTARGETGASDAITMGGVQTGEGRIVGTVSYMSPEQAQGLTVDERSDIFSFGSLLYEMISGQRPFQGDSSVMTLAAIIEREPPSLSGRLPEELERVLDRCLQKDVSRRYQHIADVRVALQELVDERVSQPRRAVAKARGATKAPLDHGRRRLGVDPRGSRLVPVLPRRTCPPALTPRSADILPGNRRLAGPLSGQHASGVRLEWREGEQRRHLCPVCRRDERPAPDH